MNQSVIPPALHFYSSQDSYIGRHRRWLWYIFGAILLLVLAVSKGSFTALLLATFVTLPILVLVDWRYRRALAPGKALVTLTDSGIESPFLTGRRKTYQWSEVSGLRLLQQPGNEALALTLVEKKPSRLRSFFQQEPSIPLTALSATDRTALLAAVHGYVSAESTTEVMDLNHDINAAAEFEKRLKALAPHAWVTYALVGVNVAIWLLTLALGAELLDAPTAKLFAWGGNAASEVQRGDWWRLVSAMFLHSGVLHVGMNMVGLVAAGVTVERIFGHRQYALIYFGSGLLGGALSLHFSAQKAVSVGASGAVFGIAGALLVAVYQHRDSLPKVFSSRTLSSMGFFVLYSLLQGFGKQGIDNAAHIGGLIGGMALAFILPERFDPEYFRRRFRTGVAAAIAALGISVAAVVVAAPAAIIDQRQVFASAAAFEKGMHSLQAALAALQQEQEAVKSGRLSEREADDRSRTVFAPRFRALHQELMAIEFVPGDPRAAFLSEAARFTELTGEILAMESVLSEGTGKYEPADRLRAEAINQEIAQIDARMSQWAKDAAAKRPRKL